jgi:hypothetical protein
MMTSHAESSQIRLRYCAIILLCFAYAENLSSQQLRSVSQLRIDGYETNLGIIGFVDAFEDGTIVVSQPEDRHLLFFDAEGRLVARFGRKGSGPGEFGQMAHRHGFHGDTMWVLDATNQRLVYVTKRGSHVRTVRIPVPTVAERGTGQLGTGLLGVRGISRDGHWLVSRHAPPGLNLLPGWRQRLNGAERMYFWTQPTGWPNRLIAGEPTEAQVCGTVIVERLFCQRPLTAVGPYGEPLVLVNASFDAAASGRIVVTSILASGDTSFVLQRPFESEPVPRRLTDSIRAEGLARARTAEARARWGPMRAGAAYSPLSGSVIVGKDGSIWIGLRTKAEGNPWLVVGKNGKVVGNIVVPNNLKIRAPSATAFWATETDEDDMQSVVRHMIVRTAN